MTYRILKILLVFAILFSWHVPPGDAAFLLSLPEPGAMVGVSPPYRPAALAGLKIHADNPFAFDFIVDVGQGGRSPEDLKHEGGRLMEYFLAALTIPEEDMWVNLSPYERGRIVPGSLGQTAMGRDLLAQDYVLKQFTASLLYPEHDLGRRFWERVYTRAGRAHAGARVPVNAFNKVWILADRAEVYEKNGAAFITDCHLKVMLEEDYLARERNAARGHAAASGGDAMRAFIIPAIEQDVNTGRNFASLRQMFHSMILANWYKKRLTGALLNQAYADQGKVNGIALRDKTVHQRIYERYVQAYRKGVFNFVKEDAAAVPRKYFSGGVVAGKAAAVDVTHDTKRLDAAMAAAGPWVMIDAVMMEPVRDAAMAADRLTGRLIQGAEGAQFRAAVAARLDEISGLRPDQEALVIKVNQVADLLFQFEGTAPHRYRKLSTRGNERDNTGVVGSIRANILGLLGGEPDMQDVERRLQLAISIAGHLRMVLRRRALWHMPLDDVQDDEAVEIEVLVDLLPVVEQVSRARASDGAFDVVVDRLQRRSTRLLSGDEAEGRYRRLSIYRPQVRVVTINSNAVRRIDPGFPFNVPVADFITDNAAALGTSVQPIRLAFDVRPGQSPRVRTLGDLLKRTEYDGIFDALKRNDVAKLKAVLRNVYKVHLPGDPEQDFSGVKLSRAMNFMDFLAMHKSNIRGYGAKARILAGPWGARRRPLVGAEETVADVLRRFGESEAGQGDFQGVLEASAAFGKRGTAQLRALLEQVADDSAMTARSASLERREFNPGGIDLTARDMRLKIRQEGAGVPWTMDAASLARIRREGLTGLTPRIRRIVPLPDAGTMFR